MATVPVPRGVIGMSATTPATIFRRSKAVDIFAAGKLRAVHVAVGVAKQRQAPTDAVWFPTLITGNACMIIVLFPG
jgi:hypothetical protein